MPARGGPPSSIASISTINSAVWGSRDRIVVSETVGELHVVHAQTGDVRRLTEVEGHNFHDAPDFLPGGEALVMEDDSGLALARMADGSWEGLGQQGLDPRWSPGGTEVAVSIMEPAGDRVNVWLLGVESGSRTRLTTNGEWNLWPVWTHAGRRICYMSEATLWWKLADGSGDAQRLKENSSFDVPLSWNEELQALAFYDYGQVSDLEVWHSDGEVEDFLVTEFDERSPHFSPDGRWIAYVSDQSGIDEVYVRPYAKGAGSGARLPISSGGGIEPAWSSDGGELYYRWGTRMYTVAFTPGPPPRAEAPVLLFDEPYHLSPVGRGNPNYDVGEDGRFLMLRGSESALTRVHVIRGWQVGGEGAR